MGHYGILLSCEHGGNDVPARYQPLFSGRQAVLESHRGWDPATLELARSWSEALSVPLVYTTLSRLVIEMNRSLDHPSLFSEFTCSLPQDEKLRLINDYYAPYRAQVKQWVEHFQREKKQCLHCSVHSFTPVWKGQERKVDIGLLFDPARSSEVRWAKYLKNVLEKNLPDLQVGWNQPYLGTDDGLTTYLRTQYSKQDYAGLEIEINQKWVDSPVMERIKIVWKQLFSDILIRKPVIRDYGLNCD